MWLVVETVSGGASKSRTRFCELMTMVVRESVWYVVLIIIIYTFIFTKKHTHTNIYLNISILDSCSSSYSGGGLSKTTTSHEVF